MSNGKMSNYLRVKEKKEFFSFKKMFSHSVMLYTADIIFRFEFELKFA